MDAHTYMPIPPSRGMIRLLRLFKGFPTDTIRCELFQTTLHQKECVTYEALSYTWGSATILEDITIWERTEGSAIKETKKKIGTNLHAALRYLRTETRDRVLWIDAICIDQSNEEEKTDQIGQMRLVYEEAEQVLIWLGQSNEDIDMIMDSMARLHKEASTNYVRLEIAGPIFRQQLEDTHSTEYLKLLNGFRELLRRPWFQRVWIIQEVASARAATIVCGSKSVQGHIFALMPPLLGLEVDILTQAVLDIFPGPSRKNSWWSDRRDLHILLNKFATSQATEGRDKVFALLGISSDARKSGVFPPNCTRSLEEVCRDTLCFLLFKKVLPSSIIILPSLDLRTLVSYLDNIPELASLVTKWAVRNRHQLTAAFLMEVGGYTAPDGTLAYMTEHEGNNMLISYFLARNAIDNRALNGSGETALNIAARKGNEKAVALLLGCPQIDVDHEDVDGITPLAAATTRGHLSTVKLLLDQKAHIDMNHRDVDGITPLAAAVIHGHHLIVELLQDQGEVDVNERGPLGITLISIARILGHLRVSEVLIADKNLENCEVMDLPKGKRLVEVRRVLLTIMARDDDAAGLRALVNAGVQFRFSDKNGRTPLARAAMAGASSATEALAENMEVDCQDFRGRTPLSLAAERGHLKICEYLMVRGADILAKDHDGKSALDWAQDRNELEGAWVRIKEVLSVEFERHMGSRSSADIAGEMQIILKAFHCGMLVERVVRQDMYKILDSQKVGSNVLY
ncbi:ankyrin repeat-containing domain protein [Diplogelasinospora grovesii]|uniref:Ankyrin repeat-containing domain protein n=1 Tax=Diplogelasinospora grovesii TaxID=303347 RepID=A0AAN6S3H3_9PEZI|nr:ankyrin repeat-containing domain protein [Diplogelasinospora grovesii]